MDSPSSHPRRRPQKATGARPPLPGSPKPSLRKVDTFNVPSRGPSSMIDPVADAAYIPKRSPTSSKALEDLIAPRPDIVELLHKFDDTLAGLTNVPILKDAEVWAVPNIVLEHTNIDDFMDIDEKDEKPVVVDHDHLSDSGLGASIESFASSLKSSGSAINKSFSAPSGVDDGHSLSDFAAKEIKQRILDPILKEDTHKAFHRLLADVPRRVDNKEIRTLRDLEKNLLYLAFDSAPSAESYQLFCQQTISFILATVDSIPASDRHGPADLPYTNSYAIDLVQQIRRYAEIMAETRARQEAGKPLDEKDYSPDEELTIEGGLSYDGKPAQLVRKKDGKTIPIASPEEVEAIEKTSPLKRAFSEEDLDGDDATRSMARRRKSDRPGDVIHSCNECGKDFKRPCDLTKHEKTHLRPWKCPEESCKYHVDGWPTEKECERHVNDRHNAAPTMYKCNFSPCTYTSKRESNCKQHMEKSHGYTYVRSKNNGRNKTNRTSEGSSGTPATPLTPFINTPASALMSTPATPFAPSPALPNFDFNNYHNPIQPSPMVPSHDVQDSRRQSMTTSGSLPTSSTRSPFDQSSFEDAFPSAHSLSIDGMNFDMNQSLGTGFNFHPINFQQVNFQPPPTPATMPNSSPVDFDYDQTLTLNTNFGSTNTHLSPTGQADATLLSPHGNNYPMDEGFGEGFDFRGGDFDLYPETTGSVDNSVAVSLFSDMNGYNQLGGPLYDDMDFVDMANTNNLN
ncbi:hypothetical protein NA57DRAFT_55555 [Rhizodiscina lignyota]|uniref:C2H2-type domain-containing protein n=1 Tax=Rhizodiscina lignyota TaxID=1504668 RepID=A0A9P4IK29_9PEZI|nr:hypothetical protein NA57DRAFT_55555 [Rhizodiscina lignyota]